MADEYIKRLTAFLAKHDITDYYFGHRAKHRELVLTYKGVTYRTIFPASGSDWRGPANTVSDLRHTLGLFDKTPRQTNGVRIRQKRKQRANNLNVILPVAPPVTPVISDRYYAPLQALKARLEAAAASNDNGMVQSTLVTTTPSHPNVSRLTKVRIHTPWLGRRVRYAYLAEFSSDGQVAS